MIDKNDWFVCSQPNPAAKLRLFCFPYSGSGASLFHNWSENLPPTVELWAAQLPGRGRRLQEQAFLKLLPLVEKVKDNIHPMLDRPFAFFGHSMGALLSFELARSLRRIGKNPLHLFLSGRGAPQLKSNEAPIHQLPESEFIEKIKNLNGMSAEILESEELMQLLVPILRADFSVCETYDYVPEPPLSCTISAYGGVQDDGVSSDRLDAWREHTIGAFSLHMFPGDHFFINTSRQLLLKTMSTELNHIVNLVVRSMV